MAADPCIFCQMVEDKAPIDVVYRGVGVFAFRDIHPVAPTHILIVPTRHIASVNEMQSGDTTLLGELICVAQKLALQENIAHSGFRLILNTGPDGGQTVFHLHLHLIGGRRMHWPPG
jgi:histidine triad (HIT) family protein